MGNFVGSDAGHIQSVKVLKNMVSSMLGIEEDIHNLYLYLILSESSETPMAIRR